MEDDCIDAEQELRTWVRLHGRAVESCIARYERDLMAREEILADVVRLAFARVDELRELTDWQLRAWFLRTARFMTANASRRAATRRRAHERLARQPLVLVAPAADDFVDDETDHERGARSARIGRALSAVRDDYRRVLILDALGESGPKIAAAMGISPQAARSRLMRARAAFVDVYNDDGADGVGDMGPVSE